MQVKWVIDDYMLENDGQGHKIKEALIANDSEGYFTKYIPFESPENIDYGPYDPTLECVVLYGTHNFVRSCPKPYFPGAYGLVPQMSCEQYYSYIPLDWMLNKDFIMLPYSTVKYRREELTEGWTKKFFFRPISGTKTFTGQIITRESDLMNLNVGSSVSEDTICMVCPSLPIHKEFRTLIVNGEVIEASEYRADDKFFTRRVLKSDIPLAWNMAQMMASHSWQPDDVYTCDIALTDDENGSTVPRIIELNSFCCAGMYSCDWTNIISAINEAAIAEWQP